MTNLVDRVDVDVADRRRSELQRGTGDECVSLDRPALEVKVARHLQVGVDGDVEQLGSKFATSFYQVFAQSTE